MRPGLLLLVAIAVLFACVHSSPTKSSSTSVRSTRSDQDDVPVHRSLQNGTDTSEEERVFKLDEVMQIAKLSITPKLGKEDSFEFLRLHEKSELDPNDKLYKAWIRHVVQHPDSISAPFLKGLSNSGKSKIHLQIIEDLEKTDVSKQVLDSLKSELINTWENDKTASLDDVFTALKLDKAGDKLIDDPNYKIWLLVALKKPDSVPNLAIKTVLKNYGIAGLLEMFEYFSKRESVLIALDSAIMNVWRAKKTSVDDAFTELKLDKAGNKLLEDPRFITWFQYANEETGSVPNLAIKTVSEHNGDVGLLTMLEAFFDEENTSKAVMTTLESALMDLWKKKGMSMNNVFKLLKLDQKGDNLLRDKLLKEYEFGIWLKYAAKESHNLQESTIKMVLERYGDVDLLKMLKVFADAKASKTALTRLESALVASWKVKKLSLVDVFKLLKLKQRTGDSLHENLLREIWLRYRNKNASKQDVAGENPLHDSVENPSHLDGKSADDAFTALDLDKAGDKLFSDPQFEEWFQFVAKGTGTLPESAAKTVSKHYNDEDLLKMFEAFANAKASDAVMTTLESALMVSWKDKKMSTLDVFKLLKLDQKGDDLLHDKLFSKSKFGIWAQYAAKKPNPFQNQR
ncbi:hypothetical protein DD238_008552 [Peronospora effusa]|uniref:RxLR effector PexRD54 WY domain-containing protein n=2 Tax=Peronospora effusa TaxID=542832 RepID=A0A3M6V8H6_9STRA|nr:hypothetical protein DD238_008552 [Peronospora effusa]